MTEEDLIKGQMPKCLHLKHRQWWMCACVSISVPMYLNISYLYPERNQNGDYKTKKLSVRPWRPFSLLCCRHLGLLSFWKTHKPSQQSPNKIDKDHGGVFYFSNWNLFRGLSLKVKSGVNKSVALVTSNNRARDWFTIDFSFKSCFFM